MTPPQLARYAPVLDLIQPLPVPGRPVLGKKPHVSPRDDGEPVFRQAVHLHEPLVGQQRFDDDTCAAGARHTQFVGLLRCQQVLRFQIDDDPLTRLESVQATISVRRVFVHFRVECHHADLRQVVALSDRVVVEIVCRGDLHAAGSEFRIDVVVSNDRDRASGEGKLHALAY